MISISIGPDAEVNFLNTRASNVQEVMAGLK